MASSLFLISCANEFPAKNVYYVDINKKICNQCTLDQDKIKVSCKKAALPLDQCPSVIGFTVEDDSEVMSWARRMKEKLSECGQ